MAEATRFFLSRCFLIYTIFIALSFSANTVHADAINDLLGGSKAATSEEETSTKVITTDDTRVSDRKIRSRLIEIFAELDTLNKLKIDVNKGVVTLSGEVSSSTVAAKANSLANKVEGVVEVENEITVTQSVEKRLETTWKKSTELGNKIITALPLLLLALTVFIIMWFIGRWISHREKLFSYFTKNAFIANLLGQITHLIFIVIGLVLALSLLDATALLGTIMGAAGIFGLAIGFAVRDTVENYIASILLSLRNPFQVKDYVDINGNQGSVARLTSRATILITADGNHLRIPNSEVYKAVIINFTRNSERRFTFDLGIDAAQDLTEAQQLAVATLNQIEGVLDDPKPMALIEELGDFNVLLRVYGWVDQDHFSFSKVRSEAIKKSKQAFDDANIVMPEPIYQVRMTDNTSGLLAGSLANTVNESVANKQAIKPKNTVKRKVEESVDVRPDDTAIDQIEEEFAEGDQQNLLSEQAPNE